MKRVDIRQAKMKDVEDIQRILLRYRKIFGFTFEKDITDAIRSMEEGRSRRIYVAQSSPVSGVLWFSIRKDGIWIRKLAVKEKYEGIGTQLVNFLWGIAKKLNKPLLSIVPADIEAIHFYKKCGFQKINTSVSKSGRILITMIKRIC